jgi:hypothetical protein
MIRELRHITHASVNISISHYGDEFTIIVYEYPATGLVDVSFKPLLTTSIVDYMQYIPKSGDFGGACYDFKQASEAWEWAVRTIDEHMAGIGKGDDLGDL